MPRISPARQLEVASRALAEATGHETRYPVQATSSSPASITPFGFAFPADDLSHSHLPLPATAFLPTPTTPALEQQHKSTCSGDRDHVKRPPNAFILFRSACCKESAGRKRHSRPNLNTSSSERWKALSPEQKKEWETFARVKEAEHKALHPDWIYRPQRRYAKNRVSESESGPVSLSSFTANQRRRRSVSPQRGVVASDSLLPALSPTSLPLMGNVVVSSASSAPGFWTSSSESTPATSHLSHPNYGLQPASSSCSWTHPSSASAYGPSFPYCPPPSFEAFNHAPLFGPSMPPLNVSGSSHAETLRTPAEAPSQLALLSSPFYLAFQSGTPAVTSYPATHPASANHSLGLELSNMGAAGEPEGSHAYASRSADYLDETGHGRLASFPFTHHSVLYCSLPAAQA